MQIIKKNCTRYHDVTDTEIANNFFFQTWHRKSSFFPFFRGEWRTKQNGERKGLEKYDVFENKIATVSSSRT